LGTFGLVFLDFAFKPGEPFFYTLLCHDPASFLISQSM
jgi:hypothetical protein